GARFCDAPVPRCAVHLDAPLGRADDDVARSRVELGLTGDGLDPLVAGSAVDPRLAADRPDGDVAARCAHARLAGVILQLLVARAGLHVDGAEPAPGLDV